MITPRFSRRALAALALSTLAACARAPQAAQQPAQPQPTRLPALEPQSNATALPQPTPQLTARPTPVPEGKLAPELEGGGAWLNSEPLTLAGLRGQVVLVNFWTFGCYNCRNTLPFVRQWWADYQAQGLVIVGVHTPEFRQEQELENVRAALEREQITWPVVQDNDYTIWRAYRNNWWPRFYLIDHTGRIIYDHIGEGAYDETARRIEAALAAAG